MVEIRHGRPGPLSSRFQGFEFTHQTSKVLEDDLHTTLRSMVLKGLHVLIHRKQIYWDIGKTQMH
jgi:hypothetical protein